MSVFSRKVIFHYKHKARVKNSFLLLLNFYLFILENLVLSLTEVETLILMVGSPLQWPSMGIKLLETKQNSIGEFSVRGIVRLGNCPVGELSSRVIV